MDINSIGDGLRNLAIKLNGRDHHMFDKKQEIYKFIETIDDFSHSNEYFLYLQICMFCNEYSFNSYCAIKEKLIAHYVNLIINTRLANIREKINSFFEVVLSPGFSNCVKYARCRDEKDAIMVFIEREINPYYGSRLDVFPMFVDFIDKIKKQYKTTYDEVKCVSNKIANFLFKNIGEYEMKNCCNCCKCCCQNKCCNKKDDEAIKIDVEKEIEMFTQDFFRKIQSWFAYNYFFSKKIKNTPTIEIRCNRTKTLIDYIEDCLTSNHREFSLDEKIEAVELLNKFVKIRAEEWLSSIKNAIR